MIMTHGLRTNCFEKGNNNAFVDIGQGLIVAKQCPGQSVAD